MTTKVVARKEGSRMTCLEVRGHSGYAPSGRDIVCSSITTLVQVLHTGITDVLGINAVSVVNEDKTFISVSWDDPSPEAQAIGSAVCEVFRTLAKTYPKNVKFSEVQKYAL